MSEVLRLLNSHPSSKGALKIAQILHKNGHRVLFAGGCVRDALLGIAAKDLDLATSASPDQITEIFSKTVDVGKSFGVMRVLEEGGDYEVATFRKDGNSVDGRHPTSVTFSDEKEDALRRDFTVNALFYDSFKDEVLDYVQGQADLTQKILRTVGKPLQRFNEDYLRVLRAVRFAVQLDFKIENDTWASVQVAAKAVSSVSRERIRDELVKMFKYGAGSKGSQLLKDSGLLNVLLPTLEKYSAVLSNDQIYLKSDSSSAEHALSKWLAPIVNSSQFSWDDINQALDSLKLAKAQRRFISTALETMAFSKKFWSRNLGYQLTNYDDSSVRWGLTLQDMSLPEPRHVILRQQWQKITANGALPGRFVNGNDLQAQLKGPELGLWLERLYEAQLEGKFKDKTSALAWLQTQLKVNPA